MCDVTDDVHAVAVNTCNFSVFCLCLPTLHLNSYYMTSSTLGKSIRTKSTLNYSNSRSREKGKEH